MNVVNKLEVSPFPSERGRREAAGVGRKST
jgi:hypothetical protein